MIRRSPTRIELKLEDIQEFDFVQRSDKKKHPGLIDHANMSMSTQAKLLRHERIGFRTSTIRSGSSSTQTHNASTATAVPQPSGSGGPGPSGASNVATPASQAFSTPSTSGTGIVASTPMETGAGNASVSMDVTPVAGASDSLSADTTVESTVATTAREDLSEMDLVEYNSSLYTSAQMSIDDD